jgi:F0F1-type ATP synthase membrane subunit b/b'
MISSAGQSAVFWKTAILIVFTVFLIDFVWEKISPVVSKIIEALRLLF